MFINTINSTKSNIVTSLKKAVNNPTVIRKYDINATTNNLKNNTAKTYSKSSYDNYGNKFTTLLEELGYFNDMEDNDINAYKAEIQANIYNVNNVASLNGFSSKLTESVLYMQSIVDNFKSDKANDLFSFINNYQDHMISKAASTIQKVEDQEQKQNFMQQLYETKSLLEQLKTGFEQADAMEEAMDVYNTCLKIAMAIMHGKKVKASDIEYLMKNNPDLYKLAMTANFAQKKDKEEMDEIAGDDEGKGSSITDSIGEQIENIDNTITEMQAE